MNKSHPQHHTIHNIRHTMESIELNPESPESAVVITNQVPGYYKCGHCALHFKTRARFRAHEATCLSLKQIRTRATFATESEHATTADLFALVQQLAVRLETVEHELSVLKRQQQQEQRQQMRQNKTRIHRDNLLQWLNDPARLNEPAPLNDSEEGPDHRPYPTETFSDWLPVIPPLSRDHLALVFQHGFIDGMCAIIACIVTSSCPLCAYDETPGTLFVYEQQEQDQEKQQRQRVWRAITHAEFERFINRMQKLLMNEFVCWQQENKEKWHDTDFAEQYDANLLKVTGSGKAKSGGCSNRDMLITRMKPKVYAAIKRSANA